MNLGILKMVQWIVHALILAVVVFWIPYGAFSYSGVTWDPEYVLIRGALGVQTHLVFAYCDNSMHEKDWRCRTCGTQAT